MNNRCYEKENNIKCCQAEPIEEEVRETICDKYIIHEVPHIIPMNTKIVNHHIYKHVFIPHYTCCEIDVCENI